MRGDTDIPLKLKSIMISVGKLVCKFLWTSRDVIDGF